MEPGDRAFTRAAHTADRLHGRLRSHTEALTLAAGLTASRWQVLDAVHPEPGAVSQVARGLGTTRQSVQRIADQLVSQGMAEYLPNPEHSRAKLLAATEQGRAALDEVRTGHDRLSGILVGQLGEKETERILEALNTLSQALPRPGADRAQYRRAGTTATETTATEEQP
ncbi:MarR family winged helix-turn-helix transcriptional regulator [Nocardiopsis oceani]